MELSHISHHVCWVFKDFLLRIGWVGGYNGGWGVAQWVRGEECFNFFSIFFIHLNDYKLST